MSLRRNNKLLRHVKGQRHGAVAGTAKDGAVADESPGFVGGKRDLAGLIFGLGSGLIPSPQGVITAAHDQGWTFRGILEKIAASKNKKVRFLPIPWRLLWLALKTAETLHAPIKFRSDSVVSLVNQNPHPSFNELALTGVTPRPFQLADERHGIQ